MNRSLTIVLLLALVFPAPRADVAAEPEPQTAVEKDAVAMAAANNAFARDLYGVVRRTDGNIILSPYSVHSGLLMAREGARGETATQLDAVTHIGSLARWAGYQALRKQLRPLTFSKDDAQGQVRQVPVYELSVANAVWGQRQYFMKDTFLAPLRDDYRVPLRRVDFDKGSAARRIINEWAARQTRDGIKGLVGYGMPRPRTRLLLANALYLRACWDHEFEVSATKTEPFAGPVGKNLRVPMMRQLQVHRYAEIDDVQVVELPYLAAELSMVVFLPRKFDGLVTLERKFAEGALGDWARALAARRVDLRLPRFKIEGRLGLAPQLSRLGMGLAFDRAKADFSAVTERERLPLGGVVHKGFIAVDEKGTAVAAVTSLYSAGLVAPPGEPVVFHANRSFFFLIRHRKTGAFLFLGRVVDPAP